MIGLITAAARVSLALAVFLAFCAAVALVLSAGLAYLYAHDARIQRLQNAPYQAPIDTIPDITATVNLRNRNR